MRFDLELTPNREPVPFDHVHCLIRAFHRWAGSRNDLHDGLSLHSLSWLRGGRMKNGALDFPDGSGWRIGIQDVAWGKKVIRSILEDPEVAYGLRVATFRMCPLPSPSTPASFFVESPVVLRRRRSDGSRKYLLWDDDEADQALTRLLQKKLVALGRGDLARDTTARFDPGYPNPKTKLTRIKGVAHRGSLCPVIIDAPSDAIEIAWHVGVGELTGSGFGALGPRGHQ